MLFTRADTTAAAFLFAVLPCAHLCLYCPRSMRRRSLRPQTARPLHMRPFDLSTSTCRQAKTRCLLSVHTATTR